MITYKRTMTDAGSECRTVYHCECPICGEEFSERHIQYPGSYWTPPETDVHPMEDCEHVYDVEDDVVTFARVWFIKLMGSQFGQDVTGTRDHFARQWKWFGPRVWKWRRHHWRHGKIIKNLISKLR